MKSLLFALFLSIGFQLFSQVVHPPLGRTSKPDNDEIKLTLIAKIHNWGTPNDESYDIIEPDIISPKSAVFLEEKGKFYVNSLEGYMTVVFSMKNFQKIKSIHHDFGKEDAGLFQETNVLNYHFLQERPTPNIFKGKPVECTLTHGGKYLWVTYYRRSYDPNAMEPSAMAIIDTDKDEVVRVMPTGPLPKMIAGSPDGKYLAVTHWGDNTIGIVDISSDDYKDFKFVDHFIVGYQAQFTAAQNTGHINRDSQCGYCLRGTVFTKDSKYLLVGRMGGGGIAVFDMKKMEYVSTVFGMRPNVRHLVVTEKYLYLSSNRTGYIQKTPIDDFLEFALDEEKVKGQYTKWKEAYAGIGARTIEVSDDEKYIFVAVNNESKIVVIRAKDMVKITEIKADSFPVGLALRKNNYLLISTSQAHPGVGGGNCVNVYYVRYLK
ncbi:MAG: peptidoglycan-binding protein [Marinilabiliales bacterium]|nr:MAG: peptidoglycan-binding protein [Marinilabiliales bacterium]